MMESNADAIAQDFVENVTDALQQGQSIDPFMRMAGASDDQADLLAIIQALSQTMRPIEPSADYAARLKRHLQIGDGGFFVRLRRMYARLRRMPARLHIAAILAVFAGFSLLLSRRLFGAASTSISTSAPAPRDIAEETVATAL